MWVVGRLGVNTVLEFARVLHARSFYNFLKTRVRRQLEVTMHTSDLGNYEYTFHTRKYCWSRIVGTFAYTETAQEYENKICDKMLIRPQPVIFDSTAKFFIHSRGYIRQI